MSFFVVERDPGDGGVRVVSPRPADDRSTALQTLSARIAAGEVAITGELFVVDLTLTTPVLLMPPAPLPAPPAGVPEAVHASTAEAADVSSVSVLGELADALKRAATSLESEGVVAPESIDSSESEPAGLDHLSHAVELDAVASIVQDGTRPAEEVLVSAPEESLAPPEEIAPPASGPAETEPPGEDAWPWTNVDAFTHAGDASVVGDTSDEEEVLPGPAPDADGVSHEGGDVSIPADVEIGRIEAAIDSLGDRAAESPVAFVAEPAGVGEPEVDGGGSYEVQHRATPDPLDEPALSEPGLILPSVIDGEDAFLPRPVILGDYDDIPVVADPGSTATSAEAAIDESALSASVIEGPPVAAATAVRASENVFAFDSMESLDLGKYTCDDCVYVNTCPKVGQSAPAECGSFQWKSD